MRGAVVDDCASPQHSSGVKKLSGIKKVVSERSCTINPDAIDKKTNIPSRKKSLLKLLVTIAYKPSKFS